MATVTQSNYFIPTHARVLLNTWPVLNKQMLAHSTRIAESIKQDEASSLKNLLTDQQVTDALNGPYQHLFTSLMAAYALVGKYRLMLCLKDNDMFMTDNRDQRESLKLPKDIAAKITNGELEGYTKRLDDLAKQYFEEQVACINRWSNDIIAFVESQKLSLAEIERNDFLSDEPLSELFDRMTDLSIPIPKVKKSAEPCRQYLKLKATVLVQNALGRLQRPNNAEDIKILLKPAKPLFEKIHAEEEAFQASLQDAIETLVKPIEIPVEA